ncbi:MAG TPA: MFS transporter [Gammaproteobacteria bacterium]|nr:MFS transporter [Gammaproteobacteria bacterium]
MNQSNYQNAWCLYDWAISAWSITIITFVFSSYFAQHLATSPEQGIIQWGKMLSVSGILIATLSPILGSIADKNKSQYHWLKFTTLITAVCAFLLWFANPDHSNTTYLLIMVGIGSISFEFSQVFYNSMLADVTTKDNVLKISSRGWSLGYLGGLSCLAIALFLFLNDSSSLIKLKQSTCQHIRIVGPLVGLWILAFSFPLIHKPLSLSKIIFNYSEFNKSTSNVISSIRKANPKKPIFKFLIARTLYSDGLTTITSFTGIFATTLFHLPLSSLLTLGISANICSAIGAFSCSKFSTEWLKPLLAISLIGLIISSTCLIFSTSQVKFWVLALTISTFAGSLQSLCRSIMTVMTPTSKRSEMFGFYKFAGKSTSFIGPLAVSSITYITHSQRLGLSVVVVFFIAGLYLLKDIPIGKRKSNYLSNKLATSQAA